ncbi:OmpA family protein [Haloferula sp. BvORR071]|uniref:OmpA family protein n=1 Tax=Haloferula sp. BvORR071 TaxID=1396141 RepID=UPI000550C57E|nr:OmpA family protein [Haloferula sp. BvORR071]
MNPDPSISPPEPQAPEPVVTKPTMPPSVLILGFMVVVLLGVLVALALKPKDAGGNDTAATDDPAMRDMKARLQLMQENVNQDRAKLGLSPLYTGETRDSAEAIAKRITDDAATLVALSKGVKDLIADKDAERAKTAKELSDALQLQTILREKSEALQNQLNQALLDGANVPKLRADLERATSTIDTLQKEIARLGKGPDELKQMLTQATSERDRLRAQVAELQARLSKTSLFAGTEAQMFKEAVELFRNLRQLEGKSDSEIAQAYSQYGVKLGAVSFGKVEFVTGSSELAPEDIERVRGYAGEAADNAYIVVIGYASETGNVDNNRVLSSDRATAVAQILDAAKKPGQQVQAAYLGQTDRFGSSRPERNQICEVWQIMPKTASANSVPPPPPAPGE